MNYIKGLTGFIGRALGIFQSLFESLILQSIFETWKY